MIINQSSQENSNTSVPAAANSSCDNKALVLRKSGLNVKAGGSNTRLNSHPTGFGLKKESCCNTLLPKNRLEVHWDWWQFTGKVEAGKLYPLIEAVGRLANEEILLRPGKIGAIGWLEFQNSGRSPNSVRVLWDNHDENNKCRCLISIPGKVMSAMEMMTVRELAMLLMLSGLECTRGDIAIDDYGKRLNAMDFLKAGDDRNYAKFKNPPEFIGSTAGDWCIYFGSRESARSAKAYNKEAESKGRIKAIRFEVKFGAKVAHDVLLKWLSIDPDKWGKCWERESAKWLMRSVVGSVDFIDRKNHPGEKNLSRIPRLDWWQAFIDLIDGEPIYHTAPVANPSLERSAKWQMRQVMRSLVCVLSGFGEDGLAWFQNQIETACASLTERHMKLIAQYRHEYAQYRDSCDVEFGMAV